MASVEENITRWKEEGDVENLVGVVNDLAAGHDPRIYAIKILGQLGDARALDALVGAMKDSSDENVQYWAALALGALGEPAVEPLIACTKDPDKYVRTSAVVGLNATDSPMAREAISALASDPESEVRSWVDAVLSGSRNPRL
jgi:HEAT repeat protein